jgi:hypothetical protein
MAARAQPGGGHADHEEHQRDGSGPSDWFTGAVYVDTVVAAPSAAYRLSASSVLVEDAGDPLELDEVVAGTHRPQLVGAPLVRSLRDRDGIGAGKAAAGLGALEVVPAPEPPRAVLEDGVERDTAAASALRLAGARGNGARDLVYERFAPAAKLALGQRQGE